MIPFWGRGGGGGGGAGGAVTSAETCGVRFGGHGAVGGPAQGVPQGHQLFLVFFLVRNVYAPGRAVAGQPPAVTGQPLSVSRQPLAVNSRIPWVSSQALSVDQSTAVGDEPTTVVWRPAWPFFLHPNIRKFRGFSFLFFSVKERPGPASCAAWGVSVASAVGGICVEHGSAGPWDVHWPAAVPGPAPLTAGPVAPVDSRWSTHSPRSDPRSTCCPRASPRCSVQLVQPHGGGGLRGVAHTREKDGRAVTKSCRWFRQAQHQPRPTGSTTVQFHGSKSCGKRPGQPPPPSGTHWSGAGGGGGLDSGGGGGGTSLPTEV